MRRALRALLDLALDPWAAAAALLALLFALAWTLDRLGLTSLTPP